MRVNYDIDPEIHHRAKVAAATRKVTLKEFLERALDELASKVEKEKSR